MALTPGTRIGSYEIAALIGVGGMGEVYRARDTRLGRDVALKVLPAGVASDADRLARFEREARTLASLNHPNINAIFGLEDVPSTGSGQAGQTALVMELVEGPTLADRIAEGPISLDEALSIAAQIAEALEAAHAQGIVHRDLKPANVMIRRDRRVKVLDFGLAKVSRSRQGEDALTTISETQAGVILGTPAYMSPEQIAGSQVDHRTDIFSLGIILYEMVTAQRPFQGKTQMELAASIMRDQPLRISRPDVPDRVVVAIEQCLVKSAGGRMQSAGSLVSELRAITPTSTSVAGERSKGEGFWVAVPPFKSTGASPELAALAEGLTEEIAAGLSRFSYFRVLTKALSGARYVIEGSLRQSGGQLRAAVKLIDTSTGANVWAENYTRSWSPDTVFETQDSLVPTIVSTIAETNGVLAHSMWVGLRDRDPTALTPYEALLRSFGYNDQLTPDEHRLALAGLKRAIEQQPNHAGCLAMLAIIYADSYLLGYGTEENQAEQAVAYGRRAVAAEPSDHFTHYALAFAHMSRKDIPAFHSAAERALALNPLDGGAMAGIAMFTAFAGGWQRGCELMQRAMTLNPRHPGWYWFPFVADAYRRKEYSRALDYALRLNLPGFFHTHVWFAAVHGQLGNRDEAAQALRDLDVLYPDFGRHARRELDKWLAEGALVEHWLEGLRKAGLAITEGGPADASDR